MASKTVIEPGANGRALLQNGKAARLRQRANFWRSVHLGAGLIFAVWLLMMAGTGVLINHQADWGLDEMEVSNSYLPGQYATEYSPEATRAHIIVADLHSGNFFWGLGSYITDLVALMVLISVLSGIYAQYLRRKVVRLCLETCDLACQEVEQSRSHIAVEPPGVAYEPEIREPAEATSGKPLEEAEEPVARAS